MFDKIKSLFRATTEDEEQFSSGDYWENRYQSGRDSGSGSYGRLAEFKAEFLNSFVKEHGVENILELGCGDGNQLSLASYPQYTGVDVSERAVAICKEKFSDDNSKDFFVYDGKNLPKQVRGQSFDLTMSLDVIFHLVEDQVYEDYLSTLFEKSSMFVIVYSSNKNESHHARHVRHRKFTDDIARLSNNRFELVDGAKNPHDFDEDNPDATSFADFYIFKKISNR